MESVGDTHNIAVNQGAIIYNTAFHNYTSHTLLALCQPAGHFSREVISL